MSRKAKVIVIEPAETKLARVPGKKPKVIDLDAADARRAAERKAKIKAKFRRRAEVVKQPEVVAEAHEAETTEIEGKTPAAAAAKRIVEPSQFQVGYDIGYKNGFKDSVTQTIHGFVATVEQKLAEHDGYTNPEKWRREATIPAWWVAVLITHL